MIISAFCGVGKSYLCNNDNYTEVECWEYSNDPNFPKNYVKEVKKQLKTNEIVFISTNPVVLDELKRQGLNFILLYPDVSLKDEYMSRYKSRGSHKDFIETLDKHWYSWLTELEEYQCNKIKVRQGEYLSDYII